MWFLICANYYPRHVFAHKNYKELVHQKFEYLKSFALEVPQRVSKDALKMETIERRNPTDMENILISSFSKAIKYSLDTYKSNDYLKKVVSARSVNTIELQAYTPQDDEWVMEIRRYIFDNYSSLQEQSFLRTGGYEVFENLDVLSKIDLQDLITLYEKEYYEVLVDNEKMLKDLEKSIFKSLGEEESLNRIHVDLTDSLADLRINFPENMAFIDLLERKKNEYKEMTRKITLENLQKEIAAANNNQGHKTTGRKSVNKAKPEATNEDFICQICNGEDYTDDDLIVFCSVSALFNKRLIV